MIQVAIATITISANRIVYADGSVNRLFFSSGPATADSLTRPPDDVFLGMLRRPSSSFKELVASRC
jgi:hypothetical protein